MVHLRKHSPLWCIQKDVINKEGNISENRGSSKNSVVSGNVTFNGRSESNVDLDIVVHQSNQRKSETRVSVKPKLERHVHSGGRDGGSEGGKSIDVSDHDIVTIFLFGTLGELVVNSEPETVMFVNNGTSNFNRDFVNENMTNVSGPCNSSGGVGSKSGQIDLEISLVDQVTVSGDKTSNFSAEISVTGKGLLHRFHGKVSVSSVDNTEKGNLRVSGDVDILGTVGDELQETS